MLITKLPLEDCVKMYFYAQSNEKAEVEQTERRVNCVRRLTETSASVLTRPEVVQPTLLLPVVAERTVTSELSSS